MKKHTRKIKVTKKHIEQGEPGQLSECPVALAIIENYDKAGYEVSDVDINGESINFTLYRGGEIVEGVSESHEIEVHLECPKAIAKFIEGFDADETDYDEKELKKLKARVKPFEFSLPV